MLSPRYDFDFSVNRKGTDSSKWDLYKGQDILPLWLGDTDFCAAPEILDAMHERLRHGVMGYTKPSDSLREIIVERLQERGNWAIQPDWLVFLPGLVPALSLASLTGASHQGSVAIPASVYYPFRNCVRRTGRRVLSVPMESRDGHPLITGEGLRSVLRPDTGILLLCNPHNPGGTVYSRSELESLATVCLEKDVLICSDEVHWDLTFEPPHTHIATLSKEVEARTITLLSPSKAFNLAGLCCAFAVIPDAQLRQSFIESGQSVLSQVNLLGFVAAEAAYRQGGAWLEQMVQYLAANRDWLHSQLADMPQVRATPPQSTFFAWLDLRALNIEKIQEYFESFGLGLSDGATFGSPGWGRLNFGVRRELLEEAVRRFATGIEAAQ